MNFIYVFYEKLGSNFIGLNSSLSSLDDGVEYLFYVRKSLQSSVKKSKLIAFHKEKSFAEIPMEIFP